LCLVLYAHVDDNNINKTLMVFLMYEMLLKREKE